MMSIKHESTGVGENEVIKKETETDINAIFENYSDCFFINLQKKKTFLNTTFLEFTNTY